MKIDYAPERDIYLEKPSRWTTGAEIRKAKENKEAYRIIQFFARWKRYGLPEGGGWGEYPAPLIEILDELDNLYTKYHAALRIM